MEDEKKEYNIFNFDSDSDDKQENENENQKKNSPTPPYDENDKESVKLEKLVNTLLNSKTKKLYDRIYVTDIAFLLKNEDFSSNFEKRAKNEEILYGWFIQDQSDEELLHNMVIRLKKKGLEKIEHAIMVSPPEDYNINDDIEFYSIIICRFILGKNVGLNQ